MRRWGALLVLLLSGLAAATAHAQTEPDAGVEYRLDPLPAESPPATVTPAPPAAVDGGTVEKPVFVVMGFESNKGAQELAQGITLSLAQRFSAHGLTVRTQSELLALLSVERQRELLGCADDAKGCAVELASAIGARYQVLGRIDRFGEKYVLNASVIDTLKGARVVEGHQEVDELSKVPRAGDELADQLMVPFGVKRSGFSPAPEMGFNLALGVGTELFTSIAALAPAVNLEVGYRLSRAWSVFLQISAAFTFGQTTNVGVTPGLLGARYNFFDDFWIQPTLGAALGVVTTIETFQGKSRPSLVLLGGGEWFVIDRVGIDLEASVDLLGLAYEFGSTNSTGVDLGLRLSVVYRF